MVYEFKDELLDLVDDNDCVIGTIWRSQVGHLKSGNIRGIGGFLVNKNGQLWIPRRVAEKKFLPLALDMSFSGHVASGESYEQAFVREVAEELRLDVNNVPWRVLGYMTPIDGLPNFITFYEILYEETPNYNRDDYCEGFWLSPQEIMQKLAEGDTSKCGLPIMIKHFYLLSS